MCFGDKQKFHQHKGLTVGIGSKDRDRGLLPLSFHFKLKRCFALEYSSV